MVDELEMAAAVLEPHFDAVKDTFVEFEPCPMNRLRKTRFVVEHAVHDSPRHFAACREDGLLIKIAPEAIDLPHEQLVAILVHEFGHAADFAYPGDWVTFPEGTKAVWIGDRDDKAARKWRGNLWHHRTDDQVERAADAIGSTITNRQVTYCGPCMIQCFGGQSRPEGLR